ncbi:ABC transporter substrate-binding protein [Magnetococcus sp. PR-3]|uniref:ABC transporter substrate-binding protein n=1 Tax=Magnetococcus sp. PR-3 TaxID=3120355 RepID=UPI002FCE2072
MLATSLCFSTSQARTVDEIEATREVRICVAGSSHQLYRAMGKEFARFLDVKPVIIKLHSWDQQFHNAAGKTVKKSISPPALLANGTCDLYPNNLVVKPWRLQKLAIVPLYNSWMTVITHKSRKKQFNKLADLGGKRVSIMKNTSYHSWLETTNQTALKNNPVQIIFADTDASMQAVNNGTVDFTLIGADGAFNWTRQKVPDLEIAFPVGQTSLIGWATHQEHIELQAALHGFFIRQHKPDSALNRIWMEHVGISLNEFNEFIGTFTYL